MNQTLHHLGIDVDWSFTLTYSGLIMARIIMVISTIPFLVGKPVPNPIKIGLAVILTMFLYPYLKPADPSMIPKAPIYLMILYMKEAFYGLSIGITASIIFYAFQAAGDMVDNQRGAAQARLLIPQLGEQGSIFGGFNYLLGIVVFLSLGGHLFFLKALIGSYDFLPLFDLPHSRPDLLMIAEEFTRTTGIVLILALQLSAPILICIFVADVVMAIMSKTAPSINVWELGFVVRGILGVFIYFLSVGLIVSQMGKLSLGMIDEVQKMIHYLAVGVNH